MSSKHTPSLEEIRRHWGLAVDVHRREERLTEFDRAIKAKVKEAIIDALKQEVSTITVDDGIYILSDHVSDILNDVIGNV